MCLPPARTHFCAVTARLYGRASWPVKTFLNCTIPALVNINVGSLRGTNGDEATISWPCFRKKLRNVVLISLTPLMGFSSGWLVVRTRDLNRAGSRSLRTKPVETTAKIAARTSTDACAMRHHAPQCRPRLLAALARAVQECSVYA